MKNKIFRDKTISYGELIRILSKLKDENNVVKDLYMSNCTIYGIPRGVEVFTYVPIKIFFLKIKTISVFMGYACEGGAIKDCYFINRKKTKGS